MFVKRAATVSSKEVTESPLRRQILVTAALSTLTAAWSATARAADDVYPSRAIHCIVPAAPGGGSDVTARIMAENLRELLGDQMMVVENRPGGASVIGTQAVATAKPDGYTIGIVFDSFVANQFLLKKVPYKISDLEPIALLVASPLVWLVPGDSPVSTPEQALAWLKANDGKLTYGSFGPGSPAHQAGEALAERAGVHMIHVPYAGAMPSLQGMLAGNLDTLLVSLNVALPYIASGKLKAIAVTTRERVPQLPKTPALTEALPEFEFMAWIGAVAPRGTPPKIIEKLSAAMQKTLRDPKVMKSFTDRGELILNQGSKEFSELLAHETVRIGDLIKRLSITIE